MATNDSREGTVEQEKLDRIEGIVDGLRHTGMSSRGIALIVIREARDQSGA